MGNRGARIFTLLASMLLVASLAWWWFEPRAPIAPDPETVRARVERAQTLRATEFVYREVVIFDERTRILGIPAGQQRILFSVTVTVTAGVDLTEGVEVQPAGGDRPLLVTLPPPRIIEVDADERSIDQYFVRERLGRVNWLEVSREVETLKERNRDDAIARGILARAEAHARAVVADLLAASGVDEVEIRFRSAELRG